MADQPRQNSAQQPGVTYASIAKKIDDVEKSVTRPETVYVNISSVFAVAPKPTSRSYAELLKVIDDVETKRSVKEAAKEKKDGPITAVPFSARAQQPTESALQGKQPTPQVTIAEYPGLQEAMQKPDESEENGSKLSRIKNIGQPKMKIDVSNLVLPGLQLSEQVNELDHIIEGLRQKAFDKEHFKIIVEEVYGLKQVAETERKEQKKSGKVAGSADKVLLAMRDKKIAEAIVMLNKGGK
jgi:hypothetical protein